jgi:tetratricopeptide (TPR) repeat protein
MAENAQVTIDPGLAQQFRSAQGALEATYAFSQTMPLGAFTQVVEAMRKAGYRPLQVRPFDANGSVQVASSWIRDSAEWRYADGLTEQEAAQRNDAWVAEGFHANSVAGYLEKGRFLFALAATKDPAVTKSRLLFGVDEAAAWKDFSENRSTGVPPLSHHVALGENGEIRFSRVAYEDKTHTGSMHGLSPRVLLPDQSDLPWYDVCLCDDRQTPQRYARQIQARKNASQPAQLSSRMQAEEALGLDEQVIATATKLLAAQANDGNALGTRARAYARLGRAEEARADVAALDAAAGDLVRVRLAAIVELWLGGGGAPALRPIDEVVLKKPKDGETLVNAASVYAEASAVAARQKKPEAQAYAEHAVSLIEQAPDLGLIGFQPSSAVWDPLRLIDRFARLEERLQSGVGYVFVRRGLDGYETKLLRGMDVTAHTLACRDLAAKGFEPWSISLAAIGSDRVAAASIWRRPLDRQALTTVARQNANAAALLLRLGEPQRVWPRCRRPGQTSTCCCNASTTRPTSLRGGHSSRSSASRARRSPAAPKHKRAKRSWRSIEIIRTPGCTPRQSGPCGSWA